MKIPMGGMAYQFIVKWIYASHEDLVTQITCKIKLKHCKFYIKLARKSLLAIHGNEMSFI